MPCMDVRYRYYLKTWGGYWNQPNDKGHKEGDHWFDSEEERTDYMVQLQADVRAENRRDAIAAMVTAEGYNTKDRTVCHRVVEFEGREVYSKLDMGYAYPHDTAEYHMEYKWTPGFNDDAAIEDDSEEELKKVKIIQEWITVTKDW